NIINNEYVSDEEFEMLKLVNQVRQEQGLNLLELDMGLAKIAREKAVDMITNNYFDHDSPTHGTPFDMIKEKGVEYSLAGENLADSNSIEDAFNSLMNSEDHKENILKDRYDKVGIGVVEKDDGGFMIVQLFIDKPVPVK
ncbi:MAG: CAP domain-containing protein, partial [Bacillota bacterium]